MPELNPTDEFDSLSTGPLPGVDAEATDGPGRPSASLRDSLDQVHAQLAAAKAEAEEQHNLYLRALADLDNFRKRSERLTRERADEGKRDVLRRLLPVLDNMQRAAEYRRKDTPAEQLVDGVLATVRQFQSALEAENVRPIDTLGKPFDPLVAEAVATQPAADGTPEGTVVAEARPGYMLGDEVLRPAQVVVAREEAK
ncbi:MAG TPA: nucleotide exchange factor GrpE [Candidatus Tumulicola sp.]|nr:nucleotide exchange factor GrpE [Candidatus Tumulicola sp.]